MRGGRAGCRSRRLAGLGAGIVLVVAALAAIGVTPGHSAAPRPAAGSLAGQLLVASTEMRDPRFTQTVIYMVRHEPGGAQGLVVNRPLGELPLAVLLEQIGMEKRGIQGTVRLHSGGPVDGSRLFVLHTTDYVGDGTLSIKDGIALSWEPAILDAIAQGKGPRRALFAAGYAGWGPGQLEAEMKAGAWVKASADEALIFDTDHASKWDRATARRKIDL